MPPSLMDRFGSSKETSGTHERFCLVSNGLFIGSKGEAACLVAAGGERLAFRTRVAANRAAEHLKEQFPDVAVVSR